MHYFINDMTSKPNSLALLLSSLIVAFVMQSPGIAIALVPKHSSAPLIDGRKSIIIHNEAFTAAAQAFAYLHREFSGVEEELVPLATIRQRTVIGPSLRQISYGGWDQRNIDHGDIRGYDAATAKKNHPI